MNKLVYINQLWASANGRVTKCTLRPYTRMASRSLIAAFPSCAPYCHAGQAAFSTDKQYASNLVSVTGARATAWQTLIPLIVAFKEWPCSSFSVSASNRNGTSWSKT